MERCNTRNGHERNGNYKKESVQAKGGRKLLDSFSFEVIRYPVKENFKTSAVGKNIRITKMVSNSKRNLITR